MVPGAVPTLSSLLARNPRAPGSPPSDLWCLGRSDLRIWLHAEVSPLIAVPVTEHRDITCFVSLGGAWAEARKWIQALPEN